MRKHRKSRRQRKRQKKIIMFGMIGLICMLSVGYAAFSSEFLISGKGTIVEKTVTTNDLKSLVVNQGDGLYTDPVEPGRYVYRGADPDNYITFNNEEAGWRIISVEADGTIKIVKREVIGYMPWDEVNTRSAATSTYCSSPGTFGCNAWAATANLIGTPSEFVISRPSGNPEVDTSLFSGTVVTDASLNTYLNDDYYNSILAENQNFIIEHEFNVGTSGDSSDTEALELDVIQEKLHKWKGKIGLISITELLRTTLNSSCTSLSSAYGTANIGNCNTNNWLWLNDGLLYEWTITPMPTAYTLYVWYASEDGYISFNGAGYDNSTNHANIGVRPVLFLKSDITLSGEGTEEEPYEIVS